MASTCPHLFRKLSKITGGLSERTHRIKKSKKLLTTLTVHNVLSGLKNVPILNSYTTSLTSGISINSKSLSRVLEELQTPEELFFYLLTSKCPSEEDLSELKEGLHSKKDLPSETLDLLESIPSEFSSLQMYSLALMSLQSQSSFAKAYGKVPRKDLWIHAFEDALDILGKSPGILSYIYTKKLNKPWSDSDQNTLLRRFCESSGVEESKFLKYFVGVFAEGGSGSVSSHACKAIGSTLSDPYKAVSGGLNAMEGHLHARAIQDSLEWMLQDSYRDSEAVETPVPGFGHSVFKEDPRFKILMKVLKQNYSEHDLYPVLESVVQGVPVVLRSKSKNCIPNGDLAAGVGLYMSGIEVKDMGPALFGFSRSLGMLSNYILDRACELPIEYAESSDLQDLESIVKS